MFDARKFLGLHRVVELLNLETGDTPEWEKIYAFAYVWDTQDATSAASSLTAFLWSCGIHPEEEMCEIPDNFAFDLEGPEKITLPSCC